MLTAKETAFILEIEVNYLHQLHKRGKLTWAEKKGKFTYYRLEDVEAFAKSRKRKEKGHEKK